MLKALGAVVTGSTTGQLSYQGTWNANTNNPTLTSGVGVTNQYYVVSTAGNTNLDGITTWSVGDWAIFNGTVWEKVLGGTTEAFSNITVTSLTGYMYANGTSQVTASSTIPVANISGAVANTVTIIAGTGLSGGGNLTANVTLNIANTAVTTGAYGSANTVATFTVNQQGQLTAAGNAGINIAVANVSGAVANTTYVIAGTGLSGGGNLASNVTINLANTAVTAGTYGNSTAVAQFTVDAQGRITSASNVTITTGGGGGGSNTNVFTSIVTITAGSTVSWTNVSSATVTWTNNSSATVTWTSNIYAARNIDATILANASIALFSVLLPSASTATGQQYRVKKIDSTANAITITTTSSQLIDNASTFSLPTQYYSVMVQSDGSNWWILEYATV